MFADSIRCPNGYVIHRNGSGILTLRGITNGCSCFARYQVTFNGNIAIPTGGTVAAIATADPVTKTIRMSEAIPPAMFDQVLVHEAAHAMMEESGLSDTLAAAVGDRRQVMAEELLAWFLETHAIEVIDAVSMALGRKVCVDGLCMGEGGTEWR